MCEDGLLVHFAKVFECAMASMLMTTMSVRDTALVSKVMVAPVLSAILGTNVRVPAYDPNVCSGNGECLGYNTCACPIGWYGSDCQFQSN